MINCIAWVAGERQADRCSESSLSCIEVITGPIDLNAIKRRKFDVLGNCSLVVVQGGENPEYASSERMIDIRNVLLLQNMEVECDQLIYSDGVAEFLVKFLRGESIAPDSIPPWFTGRLPEESSTDPFHDIFIVRMERFIRGIKHRLSDLAHMGTRWGSFFKELSLRHTAMPDLINCTRPGGTTLFTPLHQAAYHNNADAMQRLIFLGADRSSVSTTDGTPFALYCRKFGMENEISMSIARMLNPVEKIFFNTSLLALDAFVERDPFLNGRGAIQNSALIYASPEDYRWSTTIVAQTAEEYRLVMCRKKLALTLHNDRIIEFVFGDFGKSQTSECRMWIVPAAGPTMQEFVHDAPTISNNIDIITTTVRAVLRGLAVMCEVDVVHGSIGPDTVKFSNPSEENRGDRLPLPSHADDPKLVNFCFSKTTLRDTVTFRDPEALVNDSNNTIQSTHLTDVYAWACLVIFLLRRQISPSDFVEDAQMYTAKIGPELSSFLNTKLRRDSDVRLRKCLFRALAQQSSRPTAIQLYQYLTEAVDAIPIRFEKI